MSARTHRRIRQAGVSLVEALVALAVMSLGMLALVGVQSTMRFNNDLSKQRGEATRIAHEELERLRVFVEMAAIAGQPGLSWDEIASTPAIDHVPQGGIANTTYRVLRTVNRLPLAGTGVTAAGQQKVVRVQVQWTDRTGTAQTLTIESVIGGAAPALGALVAAQPASSAATGWGHGRPPGVPPEAVELSDRRYAYKPFDRGTTAWVFDSATGFITSLCTGVSSAQSAITVGDLSNCTTVDGRRLAGVVQFDLGATPSSEQPAGPMLPLSSSAPAYFANTFSASQTQARAPLCVANEPTSRTDAAVPRPQGYAVRYECVVFPVDASGWGGRLELALASRYDNGDDLPDNRSASDFRVCRYTTDTPSTDDSNADYTLNADHPRTYCVERAGTPTAGTPCFGNRVTGNLAHQNFLVVRRALSCPSDDSATALVNGNTRPHQP